MFVLHPNVDKKMSQVGEWFFFALLECLPVVFRLFCSIIRMFSVYLFSLQKIPPGMEFNHIVPHDGDMEDADGNEEHPTSRDPPIWAEVLA